MLIEGLLIGVAAVVNLGGLRFIYKKLQKDADREKFVDPSTSDDEKWFTIACYQIDGTFNDSLKTYWIKYILKTSTLGRRKIDILAGPENNSVHLIKNSVIFREYIVYLNPWVEGVLSIDEVKKNLPKVDLVPNKELSKLK